MIGRRLPLPCAAASLPWPLKGPASAKTSLGDEHGR